MTSQERAFHDFAAFVAKLKGDEKSEAQTFLFHLLEAFGHDANTLPEGSTFEYRVRFPGQKTKFADFVWPGRVLIEMKSRSKTFARAAVLKMAVPVAHILRGNLKCQSPVFAAGCGFGSRDALNRHGASYGTLNHNGFRRLAQSG